MLIYGSTARGLEGDPPHDSETGRGRVPGRDGHYRDALKRGKKVIALIAEVFGGLTPHAARFLRQLSRVAAKHAARDQRATASWRQHDVQQECALIPRVPRAAHLRSHAVVMTDALGIHDGLLKFKKRELTRGVA